MKTTDQSSPIPGPIASVLPSNATARLQMTLFVLLVLSMAATRYHHFSAVLHIADTSWAVFFLAGLYLRARWMLAALLGLAVVIDLAAVWTDGLGMTGCFSPAYPGLLLAYGALWSAGRLSRSATRADESLTTVILAIVGWLALGVIAAFMLSNLTFWAWSGHFSEMSLAEYMQKVTTGYLSHYMVAAGLYIGLGIGGMMAAQTILSDLYKPAQR